MKSKTCFDCIIERNLSKTDKEQKKFRRELKDAIKIECPTYAWTINRELAMAQAVCDDTATGEIENVQILTPLGQKTLISKEAYDKEKGMENFWKPA